MKAYRYYCKYRPPMPGAIPRKGLKWIVDFDERQSFDGVECWGYVYYDRELTEREVREYELRPKENNPIEYSE